ncbi:hypothetical protein NUU61_004123 [Penicillium alfredii]|uniref:Anaphase-promoting complex subunit 13 n=1 Tax=Penicillium alfredii TaxID=1506179 RepID=A0A9W9FKI7_9EURO|nr:uncharacterized protein NUU61_004123 [Penicillium alfredii]KAJ5101901.1 hypothetical protein NUU61_004123 [Penicillium alfredii]
MSKDSSATYLHMHQPRLADFFEEFTRPHTSSAASNTTDTPQINTGQTSTTTNQGPGGVTYGSSSPATLPSFLPIEEIYVSPQHQPPNPEDEDDVVPDQHAAFGITRAMERRREAVWRDLGLEALVSGHGHGGDAAAAAAAAGGGGGGVGGGGSTVAGSGPGATLRGNYGGAAVAGSRAIRVRGAGRKMGGRRTICLR